MKLAPEELAHYRDEGYVVARGALSPEDLDPVIGAYEDFVDRRARQLCAEGRLARLYAEEPFARRLACICRHTLEIYQDIDIMHCRLPAVFDFLRNERLMDLVEALVGPEIVCSPIQHARAKLPDRLQEEAELTDEESRRRLAAMIAENVAPWHQDAQVHLEEADPVDIVTVWLPLGDATPENGCLQIVPRIHHQRTVYWSAGFGISEQNLPGEGIVTLPMRKGDVLLMHKLIPHRSTPNRTDCIRWSMDLRYQRAGTPTGRPFYPEFVARSRANPASVLADAGAWSRRWQEALEKVPTDKRPGRQQRPQVPTPYSSTSR